MITHTCMGCGRKTRYSYGRTCTVCGLEKSLLARKLAGAASACRSGVRVASEDRQPKRPASDGGEGVDGAGHDYRLRRGRHIPTRVRAAAYFAWRGFGSSFMPLNSSDSGAAWGN